ncbi:MAG: metallophosphoesterase, partial [Verrucomicrobiota bacterium]
MPLPARSFRTLPAAGPLRVLAFGDSGAGTPGQRAVADALARESADLVLHTGDMIYPYFVPGLVDTRLFSPYRRTWESIPMFLAWGNHDLTAGTWPFTGAYRQGLNDLTPEIHARERTFPEAFFSFDAGDVHFAIAFQPFPSQYLLTTNSAQYAWLLRDLRASPRPWKVLVGHFPWNTSGGHRFTDSNLNGIPDRLEVAQSILPLAREGGVHLILHGHDHTFERFLPVDGIHTVITGGGGSPLYSLREQDPASVQFFSVFHYTRLTFEGDTLQVRAVGADGQVFDGFQIQRRPPPVAVQAAGWATPRVEPGDQPRRDGNLAGQTYDFAGLPAIPALTGRESNLGRLRVALDDTHLHLGLDSVILPPDADLFLFLEIPGRAGIDTLA